MADRDGDGIRARPRMVARALFRIQVAALNDELRPGHCRARHGYDGPGRRRAAVAPRNGSAVGGARFPARVGERGDGLHCGSLLLDGAHGSSTCAGQRRVDHRFAAGAGNRLASAAHGDADRVLPLVGIGMAARDVPKASRPCNPRARRRRIAPDNGGRVAHPAGQAARRRDRAAEGGVLRRTETVHADRENGRGGHDARLERLEGWNVPGSLRGSARSECAGQPPRQKLQRAADRLPAAVAIGKERVPESVGAPPPRPGRENPFQDADPFQASGKKLNHPIVVCGNSGVNKKNKIFS